MKFKMIHHVDQQTIDEMYSAYSPVFILSTGRSGSKFLARLLDEAPNVKAFHEPRPTLEYFSNWAFHHQDEEETLTHMIDATRMEAILDVYIKENIYVESNQCLTFFAPFIARLFPRSRFVHIIRHPGDFVSSAIRKGWHVNNSIWESGRVKMADESEWEALDIIEKLGWLWRTTNRYIDRFGLQVEKERFIRYKIEDLYGDVTIVNDLFRFCGARLLTGKVIKTLQGTRINELEIHPAEPPTMKKNPLFPAYRDWEEGKKTVLTHLVSELSVLYNYDL